MMSFIVNIVAMLTFHVPTPAVAENQPAYLKVEPNRCIALQQGQSCFAELKFRWDTPAKGEYCLYDTRREAALVCWQGNTVTSYQHSLKARKNVKYEIRSVTTKETLAQAIVKISWVYKSNTSSTSRWRLF